MEMSARMALSEQSLTSFSGSILDAALANVNPEHAAALGFRSGKNSTHTSRTIMLKELELLLHAMPGEATRNDYRRAVLDDNCLGKRTTATRKRSLQRLRELYALDPAVPLFRAMRDLWLTSSDSQPLLALLMSAARDPLLRLTAASVLQTPIGEEFARKKMTDALSSAVGNRFSELTLDKIVRNAAASWTQSGHLRGWARKLRQQVRPTPQACAYALFLGYVLGQRGQLLFESSWAEILDLPPQELIELAVEAKRLGLLNLKRSGSMIDVSLPGLCASKGKDFTHGAH